MKKLRYAAALLCMLCLLGTGTVFAEEITNHSVNHEDPIYEESGIFYHSPVTGEDTEQPRPKSRSRLADTYAAEDKSAYAYCASEEETVAFIKEQLVRRNTSFSVEVERSLCLDAQGIIDSYAFQRFVQEACADQNGASSEGDALYNSFTSYSWSMQYYLSGGNVTAFYTMTYRTDSSQEQQLQEAVKSVVAGLNLQGKKNEEKIRAIHDYICSHVAYDYDNLNNDADQLKFTAYAAVKRGKAVCQGYAELFYRMCRESGLSVRMIAGSTSYGAHAWNIVKIGNYYYNIDTTWDTMQTGISYDFYLKGSSDYKDHTADSAYQTAAFMEQYPIAQKAYDGKDDGSEATKPAEPETGHTGLVWAEDGSAYYETNGKFDPNYNGLVSDKDETYYYVENGWLNWGYTGLTYYNETWYYVENGALNWDYTGLVLYYDTWYYVEGGTLRTGLVYIDQTWYYTENGVVTGDTTDLVYYNGSWFYVENSTVNWDYTGLTYYNGTWYYVENGALNWGYTGLTYYNGTWYYVENGALNWGYTGLTYYNGTWYYVENGALNWGYTGLSYYNGTWYYVENGWLNWGYTGLAYYNGTWYYVENGWLNWGYTGLVNYNGTWYYVESGSLNWNYTGWTQYNGRECYVQNGIMR